MTSTAAAADLARRLQADCVPSAREAVSFAKRLCESSFGSPEAVAERFDGRTAMMDLGEAPLTADGGSFEALDRIVADDLRSSGHLSEAELQSQKWPDAPTRRLITLLAARGDVEELARRVDDGNWSASRRLAELLAQRGDTAGVAQRADVDEFRHRWIAVRDAQRPIPSVEATVALTHTLDAGPATVVSVQRQFR